MKYLCIENQGKIDERSFYIMGLSSKTNDNETIGKFGTGTKYGITALLRSQHEITVFSGKSKMEFLIKDIMFRDEKHQQVYCKKGQKHIETGFTLAMGQFHWDAQKGLRELVSNAIDEGDWKITEEEEKTGKVNTTRIYISYSPAIESFLKDFDANFSVYRKSLYTDVEKNFSILDGYDEKIRIYCKGVLVYEDELDSLYDYELNELDIKEDRTASRFDCEWELAYAFNAIPVHLKKALLSFIMKHKDSFEAKIDVSNKFPDEEWAKIVGDKVVVSEAEYDMYREKLFSIETMIMPYAWATYLCKLDKIKKIETVIDKFTLKGWEIVEPDEYTEAVFADCVKFLNWAGYEIDKREIVLAKNLNSNAPYGQLVDNMIYVNTTSLQDGADDVLNTITEELLHRMSGASDATRDFQSYIIKDLLHRLKRHKLILDKRNDAI